MSDTRRRRGYLDWMRGLAVLVMIEAHVLDSWSRVDTRQTWQFMWAMIAGGFGAPLFLFLAGLSVSLSAGSKLRRSGDGAAAARSVMIRGFWVFGLAFAFRIQSWILGLAPVGSLLKVDILNIMAPCIIGAAALWGVFRTSGARMLAFGAAALGIALFAPIVRNTPLLDGWPDFLAGYLRPAPGRSSFCLFPWGAFVFAGALVGVLIDDVRTREREARLHAALFTGGVLLAAGAYAASFLPSPYARSEFWGASPAFFLLRTGVIAALIAIAFGWDARRIWTRRVPASALYPRIEPWSPMQQLGRSSLFIYWIHVEMVYGLISLRIHKGLSAPAAWGAFVAFTLLMLACAAGKEWFLARRARGTAIPEPAYVTTAV